jgi:hypothetical protein
MFKKLVAQAAAEAERAIEALAAGTLRRDTPLAFHTLEKRERYARFGQWTAPDERGSQEVVKAAQAAWERLP